MLEWILFALGPISIGVLLTYLGLRFGGSKVAPLLEEKIPKQLLGLKREEVFRIINCPNSFKDQIINSVIMAGYAFFGFLVGIGATGILKDWKLAIVGAIISAGFTFFSTLVTQRGLKPKTPET